MSQIYHRANLASDDIPLLSAFQGQTVLMGKLDQDYELNSSPNNPNRLQKEKQLPQAYYCHNVMPTGKGYQSVGYLEKVVAKSGATDFRSIFVLRDVLENKTFFSPSGGKNYFFDRNVGIWNSVSSFPGQENTLVTVAYLNGETYIYYSKLGCFKYNKITHTLDPVVLTGLIAANVNGICSANGFLLAWDDTNTVYRSQSAAPLNFTPDPGLGSGAGIPEDIKGKIVVLLPISNGFIIYTTANAVAGIFQQNIRYPFIFKEVTGSSGVQAPEHVSWTDNSGEHFAWSKAGLLRLNKSTATPFYPEITDFLVAKIFEDFDETTNLFTLTKLTTQLNVKLTSIGSRFLIISYGISGMDTFTHAIVFDLAFKRFGKLKIDHVDCFNYAVPNLSGEITWDMLGALSWTDLGDTTWADLGVNGVKTAETPKEILGFLNNNGQVQIVNFDLAHSGDAGVLIMGKYQFIRGHLTILDEVEFENADPLANFTLSILTAMDGKNTSAITTPYQDINAGSYHHYLCDEKQCVGKNHSLVAKGTFNLTSLQIIFHDGGKR